MSLRFLFQHPPSEGESECKDTTVFHSTKIFFQFFRTFFPPRLVYSRLRQKKIFGKAARQGKYSLQNGAGKRRKTKKQDKNAQKCKKHELQTEPQQVKCILDPENGTIFNSLSATGREAAETD